MSKTTKFFAGLFHKNFHPENFGFQLVHPPIFKGEKRYNFEDFVILKQDKGKWLITKRDQINSPLFQGEINGDEEGERILKELNIL